jgi:hypothetical protein
MGAIAGFVVAMFSPVDFRIAANDFDDVLPGAATSNRGKVGLELWRRVNEESILEKR